MNEKPLHIALIGCGQIGGSFALGLRVAGASLLLTGYDHTPHHAQTLLSMGALDRVSLSAEDAVRDADIVMLAVPLRSYGSVIETIAPYLQPHTILTDVGSVKGTMERMRPYVPEAIAIVPGHPISGSEKDGPAAARADLYQDKLCVLTPRPETDPAATQMITHLWQAIGAIVREMPAQIHDQLYGYVSHLPHVIAFAAARQFFALGAHVDDTDVALARFLRISRSNPRMWTDVFLENRDALLQGLHTYLAILAHMAKELREGEAGDMTASAVVVAKTALPRVLASALISTVSLYEQQSDVNARAFGAGGMRDIASPAADAPEEATAFISHHAGIMANLLETTQRIFTPLVDAIERSDEAALLALLQQMQHEACAISERAQ